MVILTRPLGACKLGVADGRVQLFSDLVVMLKDEAIHPVVMRAQSKASNAVDIELQTERFADWNDGIRVLTPRCSDNIATCQHGQLESNPGADGLEDRMCGRDSTGRQLNSGC